MGEEHVKQEIRVIPGAVYVTGYESKYAENIFEYTPLQTVKYKQIRPRNVTTTNKDLSTSIIPIGRDTCV